MDAEEDEYQEKRFEFSIDPNLLRNFLDFLLTDYGFGFHQCSQIFEDNPKEMWEIFDEDCNRNEIKFWSLLALDQRKQYFHYLEKFQINQKYFGFGEFALDRDFLFFNHYMQKLCNIDYELRKNPKLFFAALFKCNPGTIEQINEEDVIQGKWLPVYDMAVHFYKKWIGYNKNTLCLIRQMDTYYQLKFLN